jgi:hypothetical protein
LRKSFALRGIAGLCAASLTACSSSGQTATSSDQNITPAPPVTSTPAAVDSPTPAPTTSSPAALDSTPSLAGTFTLKNASGDQISAAVSTGTPVPVNQAPAGVVACAQSVYADPARSLAIHMQITVTQLSSLAGQVELSLYLTGPDDSTAQGSASAASLGGTITTCTGSSANFVRLNFDSLAPQQTGNFDTWWVLPGAITPNTPTGNAAEIGQLTLNPFMGDNATGGNWTSGTAFGANLERCTYSKRITIGAPDHGIRLSGDLPTNCKALDSYGINL